MESYSIIYNHLTFVWEVWRNGRIIYSAVSESLAEDWARIHYFDSWLYESND